MSLLSVTPEIVTAASGNILDIGSALRTANAAAATQTTAITAPAADEVSAAVTALFGTHAQEFQAVCAKAAAFHDEFVNLLSGGAAQYVSTEVANAQQTLVNAVNTPAQALLGHPLIGTGQAAAGVAAANAGDFENSIQNLGPFEFTQSLGPAGVYESLTLNTPFGPAASLSLSGIPIFPSNGILGPLGLVVNGTGTVSTPFGPLVWLSANGSEWIYPGGPTYASLSGLTPLGPEAVTLSGTTANGVFQITGGTFSTLGLEFYFQGTQFGFVPEFLEPFGFGP